MRKENLENEEKTKSNVEYFPSTTFTKMLTLEQVQPRIVPLTRLEECFGDDVPLPMASATASSFFICTNA